MNFVLLMQGWTEMEIFGSLIQFIMGAVSSYGVENTRMKKPRIKSPLQAFPLIASPSSTRYPLRGHSGPKWETFYGSPTVFAPWQLGAIFQGQPLILLRVFRDSFPRLNPFHPKQNQINEFRFSHFLRFFPFFSVLLSCIFFLLESSC